MDANGTLENATGVGAQGAVPIGECIRQVCIGQALAIAGPLAGDLDPFAHGAAGLGGRWAAQTGRVDGFHRHDQIDAIEQGP